MKRTGWMGLVLAATLAVAGCQQDGQEPAVTAESGPGGSVLGILGRTVSCSDWPLHVFPESDQCLAARSGAGTSEFGTAMAYEQHGVIGQHGDMQYGVFLFQVAGNSAFVSTAAPLLLGKLHDGLASGKIQDSNIFISDLSEPVLMGDTAYTTYSLGAAHCVGFVRPGDRRFRGYGAVYIGQFCQGGIDHALTGDDITKLVLLVKGDG